MKPHNIIALLLFTAISVCGAHVAYAQTQGTVSEQKPSAASTDERTRAFELYQSGDMEGAIKLFRSAVKKNKNDLGSWHYLGLALQKQGKASDARKAHERAARLGENLLSALFDRSGFADSAALISRYSQQITEAADSARRYIELSPNLSKSKTYEWQARAYFLGDFVGFDSPGSASESKRIYTSRELIIKARILKKPEAEYTDEARNHQITGTVVLRAVLASDGYVRQIRPVATLPYGLTWRAILAARRIRFIPATIDGRPVSQYIQIEYNFNLY